MAKKLSSVLGIDIGSRKIKVAEVKAGREPMVTALGMIDTPEGAVDHTGVYNSDAVGDALKQVLNEAGASTPFAVVSIAGQASVLVRTLEVPRMNPTELKEHMQWEINRNIPFAESTVVSDYKTLGDDNPTSQNMDVVMAISPQSAIDTMIACVKKAGRQMAAIDVEPLGIARSLRVSYDDQMQDKTICVVDVGHKTTSINIYKEGKLLMPRMVPVGGELFTQAIADNMRVGIPEAESIKQSQVDLSMATPAANNVSPFSASASSGATESFQPYNPFADDTPESPFPTHDEVPQPDPGATMAMSANPFEDAGAADEPAPASSITPAPAPVPAAGSGNSQALTAMSAALEEFVAEIRRSIDYFRSRGGEVDQIVLTGGGAKMIGLAPFLSQGLGVSCDVYDPMRRLNINAKRAAPDLLNQHRQEFSVAIGNGLWILFD